MKRGRRPDLAGAGAAAKRAVRRRRPPSGPDRRATRAASPEAPVGIEPTIEDLQSSALPLGHGAKRNGEPTSAPHPGLPRAGNRTRTGDPHLGKVVLYQLSYSRT